MEREGWGGGGGRMRRFDGGDGRGLGYGMMR
jgi:hypothetical protein